MIKPEQVPKEAYAAAAELLAEGARTDQAIAAAINAWPGMEEACMWRRGGIGETIVLPLSENPNDKA